MQQWVTWVIELVSIMMEEQLDKCENIVYVGQPRPLFCLFPFFSHSKFTEKLQTSAGFELGLSK